MKDWKQEIAEAIRARCDHGGSGSGLVGPGCSQCQALFVDIMVIMNEALDGLIKDVRIRNYDDLRADMIADFKRSLPNG